MLTVEKKCNVCGEVKKLSEFPKAKTCADGHRNKCKTCDYDRQKKWKVDNKDKYLASQRAYNKRLLSTPEGKAKKSEYGRRYRINNPQILRLKGYQKIDKKKNLENDLDVDYCIKELVKPCVYCGYIDPLCNGFDRIDNTKGHTKDNCVTCCKLCNTTRMDNYTHEEFLKYIAPAIVALRKSRGDYDFEGN